MIVFSFRLLRLAILPRSTRNLIRLRAGLVARTACHRARPMGESKDESLSSSVSRYRARRQVRARPALLPRFGAAAERLLRPAASDPSDSPRRFASTHRSRWRRSPRRRAGPAPPSNPHHFYFNMALKWHG